MVRCRCSLFGKLFKLHATAGKPRGLANAVGIHVALLKPFGIIERGGRNREPMNMAGYKQTCTAKPRTLILCLLLTVAAVAGDLEKPKVPKEAPKYKIIGGTSQYEIRKYDAGEKAASHKGWSQGRYFFLFLSPIVAPVLSDVRTVGVDMVHCPPVDPVRLPRRMLDVSLRFSMSVHGFKPMPV